MRLCIVVLVAALLGGCADSHQLIRQDADGIKLSPDDGVFVAVPDDGIYGSQVYHGSGQNTAQIIFAGFAKRSRAAKVGRSTQSFDEALTSARQLGAKYLVYPTIFHWEDRATEWSSIPDKVEVKVELVDAATGNSLTSAIIKGKSGIATFGGNHPQDLLPAPVEEFAAALY